MSDPHNRNYHAMAVNTINDPVITDADSPVLSFTMKLSSSRWKRVFGELFDLYRDPPPYLSVERLELS